MVTTEMRAEHGDESQEARGSKEMVAARCGFKTARKFCCQLLALGNPLLSPQFSCIGVIRLVGERELI